MFPAVRSLAAVSRLTPTVFGTRTESWKIVSFCRLRMFTNERHSEIEQMRSSYARICEKAQAVASDMEPVNPFAVFVNNEVEMSKVNIYGFDYDYTLATYTQALDEFIFNEARDWMVKQLKYPDDLFSFNYDSDFAIRGLHFDAKRGYLMKVDAYHNIQIDTVHLGLTPVSREDVFKAYNGTYIPSSTLKHRPSSSTSWMFQLMDFFMLPEFYLLSCVIEFFERQRINYQPIHVFHDVTSSVARVHKSGLLGLSIMGNPGKYIHKDLNLSNFLNKLVSNGKKLFVISNSSAAFIDRGLRFLIGDQWREIFDVIISRANKPGFFQLDSSQFRHMDEVGGFKGWERVRSLHRGHIYDGGSLVELMALKKWNSQNILYFGDHVYSDLADVANTQGWTTAAVIPELEHEINVNNTGNFRLCLTKLRELEKMINRYQHVTSTEAKCLLHEWLAERNELRIQSKVAFNRPFGSIFRSFHNPSYFTRRLSQYAVLYTSRVANLGEYPLDHMFYPKRSALPHEAG
ncbi:HAD superfamily hydrolase subfamily IG 5' nucleotidase [Fasciola gigantica]|uniref:HAD superfamily hydrolase subfamily IG 5' nucleotidase n=1 Tax=Fasciola gigantica TaxID=46835 RepID=A0A504ZE19_FASGI|nr:HAD superfamily hydrolase subfamily IG 5' nucleotidase [Fasciola gigantica]